MMPKIIIVVAMNQDRVIGVNNKLPWHIPEDLKYFKQVTMGKPIIMGRKTFESIGRILPGRDNVVITRDKNWNYPGVIVYPDPLLAINSYNQSDEVCIIGGGQIFEQILPIADELHLTLVDYPIELATTFFPVVDFSMWDLIKQNEIISQSSIRCQFNHYKRK